jgi:hypothetical protein
VFVITFIVARNQNTQGELKKVSRANKILQTKNNYNLSVMLTLAAQLEQAFQIKLKASKSHGLIQQSDQEITAFIIDSLQFVIVQCCQHNETVELAIRKALKGKELSIEEIGLFITKQPSEVRLAWANNTLGSFINACRHLVSDPPKVKSKVEEVFEHKS